MQGNKKICDMKIPPDANARCGHLLYASSNDIEACDVASIKRPTFMPMDCPVYKLAALIPIGGTGLDMKCKSLTFAYELPRGTSLFPARCDIKDKKGKPLFVTPDVDDSVARPSINFIPVFDSKVIFKKPDVSPNTGEDIMSYYQTHDKKHADDDDDDDDDDPWKVGYVSIILLSIISILITSGTVCCAYGCYRKRRSYPSQKQSRKDKQYDNQGDIPLMNFSPSAPIRFAPTGNINYPMVQHYARRTSEYPQFAEL
jgi:hypothetical protein